MHKLSANRLGLYYGSDYMTVPGTVLSHKKHRDGTVPSRKKHRDGTIPSRKKHLDGTVPSRKKHHDGTVKKATSNFHMTHMIQNLFQDEKIMLEYVTKLPPSLRGFIWSKLGTFQPQFVFFVIILGVGTIILIHEKRQLVK